MSVEKENRKGGQVQLIGCLGASAGRKTGEVWLFWISNFKTRAFSWNIYINFIIKHDVPWVNLIGSTYYENKVPHASDPCGSFWWRDIIQLTDVCHGVSKVNIAGGSSTLFWKDLWQPQILSVAYFRVSSYAQMKTLRRGDRSLGMTELREGFHLPLSTQARQEVRQLQDDTASTEIVSEGNDTSGCQTTHRPDSLNFSSEMQLSPILSLPLRRHHHEQFSCQQGAQSCHSSFFSISAHCICCKDLQKWAYELTEKGKSSGMLRSNEHQ